MIDADVTWYNIRFTSSELELSFVFSDIEKQVHYCWLSVPMHLLIVGLLFQIWKDSRFFRLLHCCSLSQQYLPVIHCHSRDRPRGVNKTSTIEDDSETCEIAMECLCRIISLSFFCCSM